MSDANVWSYRDTLARDLESTNEMVGFDVEATDGSIGKIDELSTETSRHYLVVDTGFWIFGKKRLVPAGLVTRVDLNDRKVHIAMTKDQIKSAPDFDDQGRSYEEKDYEQFDTYYRDYGW